MSELDAFEAKVHRNIKLLSSPDAKVRRNAAAWLGESGDPNAITRLKQVYEQDPDRKVREAAAYSLGMFRALQEGMAGENSDKVYEMLEDIALRGKMGRRAAVRVSILRKLAVALLVSLAILAAFHFYLWPEYEPEINAALGLSSEEMPATDDGPLNRDSLTAAIGDLLAATRSDAVQLQEQYTSAQNGGAMDCEAAFNNPIVFDISRAGDHDDLAALATDLNNQIISLVTAAKTPYNRACSTDGAAPEPDQLAAQQATLDSLLTSLDQIEASLTGAPEPTPVSAEEMPPTEETNQEAEDTSAMNAHMTSLFASIDEARSTRGAATALHAFWDGVNENPVASGCNEPQPEIPTRYTLPDADASADLKLAVDVFNSGVTLLEQGWQLVETACAGNTLLPSRENGLVLATNARIAFDSAETKLNEIREAG